MIVGALHNALFEVSLEPRYVFVFRFARDVIADLVLTALRAASEAILEEKATLARQDADQNAVAYLEIVHLLFDDALHFEQGPGTRLHAFLDSFHRRGLVSTALSRAFVHSPLKTLQFKHRIANKFDNAYLKRSQMAFVQGVHHLVDSIPDLLLGLLHFLRLAL